MAETTVDSTGDSPHPPSPGGGSVERAGDSVGPYRLLEVLGEGGFGVVWLAERREPMVQRVALKLIRPGMDSREIIARFEQERRALALMDHPNVAKVFDAGSTPAGRPFFVMELVRGESITDYCDRATLTIRERLELFIPVCEAVQHAHMKGIIHRDLKPGNVLVEVTGGKAVPKVIDFGIAKAISGAPSERTVFTRHGQFLGTPEYISPEQAEMGALDIDTRADVYSLGVMLYELLTGMLPFDRRTLRGMADDEIRRVIREVDPPTPSRRLTTLVGKGAGDGRDGLTAAEIARRRQAQIEAIVRELRRELEWVPLRAMRKDRSRRYGSAAELAADIRNYLEGRALLAGPESRVYRARKVIKRHAGVLAAVASVFLALTVGLVGTGSALNRALVAEKQARIDRGAAVEAAHREREQRLAAQAAEEGERRERLAADAAIVWLGKFAWRVGSREQQAVTAQQFLEQLDRALDEGSLAQDARRQAMLRVLVANLYRSHWSPQQVVVNLQKGLDGMVASGQGDDIEADRIRAYLALALMDAEQPRDAERVLEGAFERSAQREGGDEVRAQVLHTYGSIKFRLGDPGRAGPALEEALQIRERLGAGAELDVAATLDMLAYVVATDQAGLTRALAMARRALDIRTRFAGSGHPLVGLSLLTIASLHQQRGELAEAAAACRRALDVDPARPGEPNLYTAILQISLATYLRDLGQIPEAVTLSNEAVRTRQRLLGDDSPLVADVLDLLGGLLADKGDLGGAEGAYNEALRIREVPPERDELAIASLLTALAAVLVRAERAAEALPLAERAVEARRARLPPEAWRLWSSRSVLGGVKTALGDQEGAEPLVRGAAEFAVAQRSLPGRIRRVMVERAVALYEAWGREDQAAAWRARLKEIE